MYICTVLVSTAHSINTRYKTLTQNVTKPAKTGDFEDTYIT